MDQTSRNRVGCRPSAFFALLLVTFFLLTTVPSRAAGEESTAFLPLKINADNTTQVQKKADKALKAALADKGLNMISRSTAKQLVDYSGAWPPSNAVLTRVADTTHQDYVAVGSLTKIGDQISVDLKVFDVLSPAAPRTIYREGESLADIADVLQSVLTDVTGFTNRQATIATIAPEGNKRIDSGAILRKISTKPGDYYNPETLRKDLKSVFTMGYFDNVEIEVNDSPAGKDVIFRVQEKPLIKTLSFAGLDELSEKDVKEAANIRVNTILNPAKLNDAIKRIKALYKSKGFYNCKAKAKLSYPTPQTADVRFVVEEGKKMSIADITFKGNTSYDDGELRDVIQTSSWNWLSWITEAGILKMDVLQQDAARINAFYNNNGFIEAKVGIPQVEEKDGDLYVTFVVDEGPRYRVGTVDIQGDLVEDKDKLISLLKVRQERFLNRKVLRQDTLKLTDIYAEHGYAFAEIRPHINKSKQGKRVNITFNIDQAAKVYFNRVEIQGNTRTRDNVIRRDLLVKEGGVYDSKAIRRSTERLQRLGYFEDVTVTPQPTMNEDEMNILVDVKEKSTGQFSIGAGYSSSDKLMFMGEISEDNFLGMGTKLALSASLSAVTTRFNLNYTDPRIFDSNVSAGIDAFNWEREFDDYTKDSYGGGFRLGHHLWERWRIFYGYTWSDTTLTNISENASEFLLRSKDINITSALRVAVVRDTRNRRFNPTAGSRNSLSVRYAGIGGDAKFTKVEGSSSWYFALPFSTVFHIKGAAGQAFENETNKLPVYENFYLGGMNSIRGLKSSSISPLDPISHEKYGGDKMWYANIELSFPLLTEAGLYGVAFTDFGNVYSEDDSWDFGTFKKTAGLGVNWLSPMGPLRLVWSYNLDKQDGDEDATWDFAMGGSF
ncbi:MAG: outer membrane protein assembly factor BamA [Desulfobulbus sp.]|nr:MAG: outer membrane protein assembly factor BamA [Desulfobulbus sp.]